MYIYIYIYVYVEREGERERERFSHMYMCWLLLRNLLGRYVTPAEHESEQTFEQAQVMLAKVAISISFIAILFILIYEFYVNQRQVNNKSKKLNNS